MAIHQEALVPPAEPQQPEATLRCGALGLLSHTVVGVAATGPAYSLTVALVPLVAAVGAQAPAALLLAFVPTVLIALACQQLNRAQPDCGTTFIWSARAFGAQVGWLAAWTLLVTDVIVMASMAQIAGEYSFRLFGVTDAATLQRVTLAAGAVWIAVTSWLCYLGIEPSIRAQVLLLGAELATLIGFAVYALAQGCGAAPAACLQGPALAWFDPTIPSAAAMSKALLVATFLYWGWDTALVVNEESVDSRRTPGRAALLAMALLLGIYVLVTVAALVHAGIGKQGAGLGNADNKEDALLALAQQAFGGGLGIRVLVLAVLTSALAGMQTTVLAATRLTLSMARLRACPPWFGRIHAQRQIPARATVAIGITCIVFLLAIHQFGKDGKDLLSDSFNALNLLVAFYYALTAFACVRCLGLRARDWRTFVSHLALPLIGGTMLTLALGATALDLAAADGSRPSFAGIGRALLLGVGSLALGCLVAACYRPWARDYFGGQTLQPEPSSEAGGPR